LTFSNGSDKNPIAFTREPAVTPSTNTSERILVELVYELLDAHDDTAQLARLSASDQQWAAHLDYLRCLQRKGRQLLAMTGAPQDAVPADSRRARN
jgi:hypothetical protein